jgi:hypothetical protein
MAREHTVSRAACSHSLQFFVGNKSWYDTWLFRLWQRRMPCIPKPSSRTVYSLGPEQLDSNS